MKRQQNERSGNGHPGYHNITSGGLLTNNDSSDLNTRHDNNSHSSFQPRRPAPHFIGNGGGNGGNDFLLDLFHCSPQHQQQSAAGSLYSHQGYQLLSAPSTSNTAAAQYHHAYGHYNFPAFAAAAMAAGGHCSAQMSSMTSPESNHNPFSTTAASSFNLQSIFSRQMPPVGNYNATSSSIGNSTTEASSSATAVLNDSTITSQPVFGPAPTDLKIRQNGKNFEDENDRKPNIDDDVANVLHCLKSETIPGCSALKKPKLELDDSDGNCDGAGLIRTEPSSSKVTSNRGARRRIGNGGRGPRGSGNHGCPYCPKKFLEAQEAEVHQESCVRQRPFDCPHCGRRFRQKTSLVQHLRIHTDSRPYQCRFCIRNFKQKSHLDQHERIHTGIKPYVCKFCSKAFRQKSGQASHELTHTNAMVQQLQMKREVNEDQRQETSDPDDDEADEDSDDDDDEADDDDDTNINALHVAEDEQGHSGSHSMDDALDGTFRSVLRR